MPIFSLKYLPIKSPKYAKNILHNEKTNEAYSANASFKLRPNPIVKLSSDTDNANKINS